MIELTWGLIRQPQFNEAMQKLMNTPLEYKDSYHISRIASKIETEQREADKMFKNLLAKFADTDEKTKQWKVKEDLKDEWTKQTTEFVMTKFKIQKDKINMTKLSEIKLTAAEIVALEPLLTEEENPRDASAAAAKIMTPDFKKPKSRKN